MNDTCVVNVNTMDGRGVRVMVLSATFNNILDLQLPVQSVPIPTKVVSSNPAYGVVFSLQLYAVEISIKYLDVYLTSIIINILFNRSKLLRIKCYV
jgi:hypothetical protein